MKARRLSYPARLFVWLLCYSLLMVGCFVAFQYKREKEFKVTEIDAQLQLINSQIIEDLAEGRTPYEIGRAYSAPFDDLRVSVIAADGSVIYDNTLDSLHRSNHLDRREIQQALTNGRGFEVRRHSESTGLYYFYSARKDDSGLIVRTAVPYSLSLMSLLDADFGFLWIMGAVTAMMCLLGYFATRRLGQHITRLRAFAENIEKGVVISDTEPFPHDELGDISNNIVRLYARLQRANADRDAEHRAAMHQQQEKERIKKQLTNNINHELKTPVASIRLSLETVLGHPDMSDEKRDYFLRRCLSNTDRLRRLLADVSLITRMDDGGKAIETEPLDLCDVIEDAVAEHSPAAEEKGIGIAVGLDGPINIRGNRVLLESVFNNLLDNAIAYSGGSVIEIRRLPSDSRTVKLTVSDNGTGVPREHLPHLFERFYRIDKGRSREAGGTGLGLSIVKNAVAFHGGGINADNRPGGGLVFTITLPACEP